MNQNLSSETDHAANESASESSWLDLGLHVFIKAAVISTLIWWIFREEINGIVRQWLTNPSWSHGFLIPLFSLYFLNQSKDEILEIQQPRPSWLVGLPLLLFFLALYPVNVVMLKFMYGKPLIVIAVIGSVVLFLGGWKILKYAWLPVAYLFFAVPLPGRLYFQLTNPMRQLAAQVATVVLNLVPQLEATVQGSTIDVIYQNVRMEPGLDVADACSGMRLVMAFVALGVAMAYLHWRPIWQRLVLLGSTLPIAILCNIVRVTITGFIYILGNPKYAQGIYHDMLGMLMLPLAFVLYGGLAWLMSNLFVDEDQIEEEDIIVRKATASSGQEK
ncbi:MAG: exosortase/archaeosortase family protein [Planctomycetota bacterium]|jgi:exosortase